jgi:CubicO group peptidase (beta-lactamase class C family)
VREELAGSLRQLRDLTGRSLRELARDIHVSSSSLSRYFAGQAVPPWPTVVALCKAAGRDPRPLREVWERALARDNVHVSFGQGQHGGWGFGMAVRTYRGDYAPIGQFGWDGGAGTSTYADPQNQLTGLLLTQVGLTTPDAARLIHDFWTTVYQSIDN